jgi:DNA-directed RNA polymerase subunit RPC12/RpoP
MKIEAALYCSECQEVFTREEHGYECPICGNPVTYLLLTRSKYDAFNKAKSGIIKRGIIITLLTFASLGVVALALCGAVKIVEIIF